jgi:hypothetical protein
LRMEECVSLIGLLRAQLLFSELRYRVPVVYMTVALVVFLNRKQNAGESNGHAIFNRS